MLLLVPCWLTTPTQNASYLLSWCTDLAKKINKVGQQNFRTWLYSHLQVTTTLQSSCGPFESTVRGIKGHYMKRKSGHATPEYESGTLAAVSWGPLEKKAFISKYFSKIHDEDVAHTGISHPTWTQGEDTKETIIINFVFAWYMKTCEVHEHSHWNIPNRVSFCVEQLTCGSK